MKKTDVTQPVAMTSAFAEGVYSSSGTTNFEIPAATSTSATDTCVLDNGFLPITSTALDDGGIAPERKNFNGMFYLSTDQRFYLQNGGFITYNTDVATAIGGYPEGALLQFIDDSNNIKFVYSLIDDNTYNFVEDETLIDGVHWLELGFASNKMNTDHSNDTKPYVITMYVNGTSWYCLWSNGFCEQGGIESGTPVATNNVSVPLLVAYANTNYSVLLSAGSKGYPQDNGHLVNEVPEGKTTGQFVYNCLDTNGNTKTGTVTWRATGYIS